MLVLYSASMINLQIVQRLGNINHSCRKNTVMDHIHILFLTRVHRDSITAGD